jgi:uncharacterized protein
MLADRIDRGQLAEMAARQATCSGHLTTAELPRLAALLAAEEPATIAVSARFATADAGVAQLTMHVEGRLRLTCQRCLEPVDWTGRLSAVLTVVAEETDAERLEDSFDCVVLDAGFLQLSQVAEDELLAAIPLAPVHAGSERCKAPGGAEPEDFDAGGKSRPFAGLAELIKAGRQQVE